MATNIVDIMEAKPAQAIVLRKRSGVVGSKDFSLVLVILLNSSLHLIITILNYAEQP
jgi:hypothetical protein